MQPQEETRWVSFGPFSADLHSGELYREGAKLRLQEQPFQVLAALLKRPGQVVTRDELRRDVWPADTFLEFDHALNTAIKKIRIALCDDALAPRYVETLPKRGYRLIAEVSPLRSRDAGTKNVTLWRMKLTYFIAGVVVTLLVISVVQRFAAHEAPSQVHLSR
jgi:DNA-binding winged helix-turn-helix (wHTH) protein